MSDEPVKTGRKPGGKKTGGRKKGTPNKLTAKLKEMIEGALMDAGGQEYLARMATKEPAAFLSLLGRTLPKDLNLGGGVSLEVNLVSGRQAKD